MKEQERWRNYMMAITQRMCSKTLGATMCTLHLEAQPYHRRQDAGVWGWAKTQRARRTMFQWRPR